VRAGANAITIHGRIVGDESTADARWGTLIKVVRELKRTESVPILINGDLYTREDIREMRRRTGCDGVMLARPALWNVSIFNKGKIDEEKQKAADDETQERDLELPIAQFQTTEHSGRYGYASPLLFPRQRMVQEYVAHSVRYRNHSKNTKYVVCEMMNSRRAPNSRVPYMDVRFPGGQDIQSVCKCRSLEDLVRVWDVRWTMPLPGASGGGGVAAGNGGGGAGSNELERSSGDADGSAPHRYDDRYFLDHDEFRKERRDAIDAALETKNGASDVEEKKMEEDGSPATKRAKI
jgi:hypothetical protein